MKTSDDMPKAVTLPSGLIIHEIRPGTGDLARPGDRCSVAFKGWLPGSPEPFDQTTGDDEPFMFCLRKGEVIDGWVEGVDGMREGGARRLIVPAALAYGTEGRDGVIPPDAELIFEIRLLQVHKRSPNKRLLVAPKARVRWQGKTIEMYVPGDPRTVESCDGEILQVLHEFSEPTRIDEVAARFPHVPAEDLDTVIDELMAAHVLIPEADGTVPVAQQPPPTVAGTAPDAGTLLFVLPPPLVDYGQVEVPSAFLFLGSLAARAGLAVDFLLATQAPTAPSGSRIFAGPSQHGMPPVLFLRQFVDEVLDRLSRLRAQNTRPILNLSCFSSVLYTSAMMVGAMVRARFPDIPITVGGCHPTIDPESMNAVVGSEMDGLKDDSQWRPLAPEWFQSLDEATAAIRARCDFVFDLVFSGRADLSFVSEVTTLLQDGRSTRPRILPAAPMTCEEMEGFRYDWPMLARVAQAHREQAPESPSGFPISFSLGCPYTCSFCINSLSREPWQGMSVDHAIEILEGLHLSCGVRRFALMDANFAARKGWRQQFFAGLSRKPWLEKIHIDTETAVLNWEFDDYDVFDRLSLTLQIGVESCAPDILVSMEKCRRPEQYLEKLKAMIQTLSPKVDHLSLMMILGYPGETRETLRQTFTFLIDDCRVLSHNNVEMCPQLYLPLRGTHAFQQTDDYTRRHGYRPSQIDWWNSDAESRFAGLRPSRGLSIETCSKIAQAVQSYYRGSTAGGLEGALESSSTMGMCSTINRSKLEQREFRAHLMSMLDQG